METKKGLRAIIPAAGKGKRLHSTEDLPKVMHRACGKPLLETVLEQMSFIDIDDIYIVVGFQKEKVMDYFGDKYHYVEQKEQLGTGHAVLVCEPWFRDFDGTVIVNFGDMPLFRKEILQAMCEHHMATGAACTLLTTENPEVPFWARLIRDKNGKFARIVEAKDCTEEEVKVKELFAGVLVFDSRELFRLLPEIGTNNAQHEYYLTELPEMMAKLGMKVETYFDDDGDDIRGVNTMEDLARCEEIMRKRGMSER